MNRNNAVFAAYSDTLVVDVAFGHELISPLSERKRAALAEAYLSQNIRTYSYVAHESWLEDAVLGDNIIVPANNQFKIACYLGTRSIAALDLDSTEIQYKWMVGFVPKDLLARFEDSNRMNQELLEQANMSRVESIRASVRQALYLEQ